MKNLITFDFFFFFHVLELFSPYVTNVLLFRYFIRTWFMINLFHGLSFWRFSFIMVIWQLRQRKSYRNLFLLNSFLDFLLILHQVLLSAHGIFPLLKSSSAGNLFNKLAGLAILVLLHKKWSFPFRTSWVNVTKSAVSGGLGHIYRRNP